MAKKKQIQEKIETIEYPKVTEGTHSTFIEHENGDVEHLIDWDKLAEEINKVLTEYENSSNIVKPKRTKRKNAA